jgi:hypothetical protein
MRSRLEAKWGALFDKVGIPWEYEPKLFRLHKGKGGGYLPDFYFKGQDIWCEIKGPHWERFDKTQALARKLGSKGMVLVATADGECWRVPPRFQALAPRKPAFMGRCSCGSVAVGVLSRGALPCRKCGKRVGEFRPLGWS